MGNTPTALPLTGNSPAVNSLAPPGATLPGAAPAGAAPGGAGAGAVAPARPLSIGQKIIHGALAGASAMAGPDANGQPRRGLAAILGGILSGAMTGLAAGANRPEGSAGGGLAAIGRGYEARSGQLEAQKRQGAAREEAQAENQQAAAKLDQEKVFQNAQISHWNLEQLHAQQMADNEATEAAYRRSEWLAEFMKGTGARFTLARIPGNGDPNNGDAMMDYIGKHPQAMKDSDGTMHMYMPAPGDKHTVFSVDYNPEAEGQTTVGEWNSMVTDPKYHLEGKPGDAAAPQKIKVAMQLMTNSQKDDNAHTKNRIDEIRAKADLARAQREPKGTAGQSAQGDTSLTGDAYVASLPAGERSLVQSITSGHIVPERLGYMLTRNPGLLAEVTAADPNFDASKAQQYSKVYQEFTSGKRGSPGAQINSAGTALKHLSELADLNTAAAVVPGTNAHTAYISKANVVANELAQFYGETTIPGIGTFKDDLMSVRPSNRAKTISTVAESLSDKLDSFIQQWKNAAPSPVYEAKMPYIDREARAAQARLDPKYKSRDLPQIKEWSASAWLKGNPGGNVDAARKAAAAAGYEVSQ